MKFKKLIKNDDAVVGIIVAVLLIGLILIVISILQTVFLPNWMKNIEAEHMDEVSQQFSQLKFAIDIQKVLPMVLTESNDLPISAPITIGNKDFPILQSSKSYGSLNINEDSCIFTVSNGSDIFDISLGNIVFSSFNSYFIDQSYIFESGAIIVSQEDGNIITIQPDINIEKIGDDSLFINLTLINISTIGNKGSASGYGTYPILVEYYGNQTLDYLNNIDDADQIIIKSSYYESWNLYFKSKLNSLGISDDSIDSDEGTETIIITISDLYSDAGVANIYLNLNTVKIGAQIAPGWVVA